MKTLVVYYSLEGNTKKAAEKIVNKIKADILELEPVKDIPKEGAGKFIKGGMKATFGMRTKLQPIEIDLNSYDRVILGTPIWASKAAPAINEFLKLYKSKEKIIGLFTLAGGGDNDKCVKIMRKKLTNLSHTVALTDRNNTELAGKNDERLESFIKELLS